MTLDEFLSLPVGTRIFNNGADQCVALANMLQTDVYGWPLPSRIDSAFQWWTEYDTQPNLNENYYKVDTPKRGDIFVGRYGIYQAENGHIGAVAQDWNGSTFGTMEQNAGKNRYVDYYTRDMRNILGFLRPKTNIAPTDFEDDMKVVRFNDIDYLIGNGYMYRSADGATTGMMYSSYGNPIPCSNLDDFVRLFRMCAIPRAVVDRLNIMGGNAAWSATRGYFDTETMSDKPISVALPDVEVNVDGLADAIAGKIDLSCDCGCGIPVPEVVPDVTTKAEILSAIEQNYPGDK